MSTIFQAESEIIKKTFSEKMNYEIFVDKKSINNNVAIYFSSNGIYFPNTEDEFNKIIIKKNRFEWKNNLIPNFHKHIFLRDIKKQWYLNGINTSINSLDRLEELLKEETKNSEKIITTGCSSGGFAAVLFGTKLKADKIFSFNGQFDINYLLDEENCQIDNPLVFNFSKNKETKAYYNLENLIRNYKNNIIYFASKNSSTDKRQIKIAEKHNNIIKIYFNEEKHGLPFDPMLLKKVINLDIENLKKLQNTIWSRDEFSKKIIGSFFTIFRKIYTNTNFFLKNKIIKLLNN